MQHPTGEPVSKLQSTWVKQLFTPIPNSNAKQSQKLIVDPQTKSHNHCVLLGGCLAEGAFFKSISCDLYMSGFCFRNIFDPKIEKQKQITFKLSKNPRGVSFHPILRRYRDENRPRPKHGSHAEVVVLPRSSQGTNYPLRGQAHVNPATGRIVPSREHVHIPTERENENHQRFWPRRVYDR